MRPASGTTVYRPDLGVAVMEYFESPAMGYIGLQVMPIFEVADMSSTYPVIPKEVMLKIQDVNRAPRGKYNRGDWEYEAGKYSTSEKGWEEPIDDAERRHLDRRAPGLADRVATQRALGMIMRSQEKRVADKLFNAVRFTPHAVGTEWNTAASAKPIADTKDAISTFRTQCGMLPDALVMSWTTRQDLTNCAEVVDRLKYTFPGIEIANMTDAQLAQCLGVPRILVGGAIYDSAKRNKAATISDIWNYEYTALVKISSGDDISMPGFGRTFLWTEDSPDNAIVESYRDDSRRSDIIRVRHHCDEAYIASVNTSGSVVSDIAAACVYLFSNIHT